MSTHLFIWSPGEDVDAAAVQSYSQQFPGIVTSTPLIAQLYLNTTSPAMKKLQEAASVGWQANHAYLTTDDAILEAGHLWSPLVDGISGDTIPDFAAGIGTYTAADGTIDDGGGYGWDDEATAPTVGSIHLYALVITPEAP